MILQGAGTRCVSTSRRGTLLALNVPSFFSSVDCELSITSREKGNSHTRVDVIKHAMEPDL